AGLLREFVVARQIAADLRPTVPLIGGSKNALRRGVEHIRIMRRKHQRRDPLKAMGKIGGAVARVINRPNADVLLLMSAVIVTSDPAFFVGVNDLPVARIGHHGAALAAAGFK
ncbi:MAG: hypothetical protein C4294_19780, partial [Nitrospiraceae bacterium]